MSSDITFNSSSSDEQFVDAVSEIEEEVLPQKKLSLQETTIASRKRSKQSKLDDDHDESDLSDDDIFPDTKKVPIKKRQRRAQLLSGLDKELGFHMGDTLNMDTSSTENLKNIRRSRMAEQMIREENQLEIDDGKLNDLDQVNSLLLKNHYDPEVFLRESKNERYIKFIKECLKNYDDDKILDFHFIEKVGGFADYGVFEDDMNQIFDKAFAYNIRPKQMTPLFEPFDEHSIIKRICSEKSLDVVKRIPNSLSGNFKFTDAQIEELLEVLGLKTDIINNSKIKYTMENTQKLPSAYLTVCKIQKLFELMMKEDNSSSYSKLFLKLVMFLMVDRKVNKCEFIDDIKTSSMTILNTLINKILRTLTYEETIQVITSRFKDHFLLFYRLINNIRNKKLKLQLLVNFLLTTGFHESDSFKMKDYLRLKNNHKYSCDNGQEEEEEYFIQFVFFKILSVMSDSHILQEIRCSENEELKPIIQQQGKLPKENASVAYNYKKHKSEYWLVRCRIRAIYDFIVLSLPSVTKPNQLINSRILEEIPSKGLIGLSSEWNFIFVLLKLLENLKLKFFNDIERIIIPPITDSKMVLDSLIFKLQRDIQISKDFFGYQTPY